MRGLKPQSVPAGHPLLAVAATTRRARSAGKRRCRLTIFVVLLVVPRRCCRSGAAVVAMSSCVQPSTLPKTAVLVPGFLLALVELPRQCLPCTQLAGSTKLSVLHVTIFLRVTFGSTVIKTRLQQQEGRTNLKYKGAVHCASTVVKEEGLTALWRGVMPTMFRNGSNSAFNFGTMALLNAHWLKKREGDGQQVPVWKTSLAGLISASVGPLFNCPVDVVKTRLMAQVRPADVLHVRACSRERRCRALFCVA